VSLRVIKSALAACAALYALLAGVGNVTDYAANFPFVQHVLMMDTTFQHAGVMWRAIDQPAVHHAVFALIIIVEFTVGVVTGLGAVRMFASRRDARRFAAAKSLAASGLLLGVLLWFGGFLVVAGEWFMMWQSERFNAQQAAFQYAAVFLLVLAIVVLPEDTRDVPAD
jgi:predicted small integral membrane protein